MPLRQTLHSTFTWIRRRLLRLIKNGELNCHFPTARVSLVSVLDERASTFLSWRVRGQPLHCLPARPPRLPHAEWLLLTPSLPAAAFQSNMQKKVLGVSASRSKRRVQTQSPNVESALNQVKPGKRKIEAPDPHRRTTQLKRLPEQTIWTL